MKSRTLLLATLGVAMLLGAVVDAASARNLSTSSQTLRANFFPYLPEEPLREPEQGESFEITSNFGTWRCSLTLEGSLHARTFAKSIGSLIGYINEATITGCVFETRILRETLPWHVRYSGFTGRLPEIRTMIDHVVGAGWRIREVNGALCLGTSTAAEPLILTYHRGGEGRLTEMLVSGRITTGANCLNIRATFGGRARASATPSVGIPFITVTLI